MTFKGNGKRHGLNSKSIENQKCFGYPPKTDAERLLQHKKLHGDTPIPPRQHKNRFASSKSVSPNKLMDISNKISLEMRKEFGDYDRNDLNQNPKLQRKYLQAWKREIEANNITPSQVSGKTWDKLEDWNYHSEIMALTILGFESSASPNIHNKPKGYTPSGKYVKTKGGWYVYKYND